MAVATLATWYAERNRYEPPTWSVVVGAVIVCLFTVVLASARDLGQWENTDPVVRAWYATVKRSSDGFPCCGEADAYWCDSITVEGDKTFCAITDDRDDGPLMRPHIPIGTKFEITPDKYAYRHGNPTGHSILFVGVKYNTIYCFVQNSGV